MAEVLPSITVTDDQSQDEGSQQNSAARSPVLDGLATGKDVKSKQGDLWSTSSTKNFPNKLIRNLSTGHAQTVGQNSGPEGRRDSQAAIDPLSQHILERTHPENTGSQRARRATSPDNESILPETAGVAISTQTSPDPTISRHDSSQSLSKDKKKGVSFLSRFTKSKKKDVQPVGTNGEPDPSEKRPEGTDADVFSQPIGFIPRFPAPPKYIKTRSQGKKEKDFNRMFLAQELRGRTGVEIAQAGGRSVNSNPVTPAAMAKDSNAIWAMEFSKDGKYLAAAGHDHILRVWSVIATDHDRQTHEREEDDMYKEGERVRLNAPVFKTKPAQEYEGHLASILDLSWSKNNFLLSSSMDKTVRLWHMSRTECLCVFKHNDFVTSIQFHPRDDRFFLAGSLDSKLRLWSIPDKSVAFWSQLTDLITAVAFTPDGKIAIAGCLNGLCSFYETEGLKYQTQIHVRSSHGKNAKGSKITGIQAKTFPPEDVNGEVKLLITSNDSRVRLYNLRDKGLEIKLKGLENTCSQIHASFSDDARYVICGSEDKKAYIWSTGPPEKDRDKRPVETFEAHSAIVTTAILAPIKTRQLLGASGDPLYDLCNPPPITLISASESSNPSTEYGHNLEGPLVPPTPMTGNTIKPAETSAYTARSAHPNGNIIVTADYMGRIKVFRQDCAYKKRLRNETWDTSSTISKKVLNRTSSVTTGNSNKSRRDSIGHPSSDRIHSWRQSIERNNGSLETFHSHRNGSANVKIQHPRSVSPTKRSSGILVGAVPSTPRHNSHPLSTTTSSNPGSEHKSSSDSNSHNQATDTDTTPTTTHTVEHIPGHDLGFAPSFLTTKNSNRDKPENPLWLQGDQSYLFWNKASYRAQAENAASQATAHAHHAHYHQNLSANNSTDGNRSSQDDGSRSQSRLGVPLARGDTRVSKLSSEESSLAGDGEAEESESSSYGGENQEGDLECYKCGGKNFRMRVAASPGGIKDANGVGTDASISASAGAAIGGREKVLVCGTCGTPA